MTLNIKDTKITFAFAVTHYAWSNNEFLLCFPSNTQHLFTVDSSESEVGTLTLEKRLKIIQPKWRGLYVWLSPPFLLSWWLELPQGSLLTLPKPQLMAGASAPLVQAANAASGVGQAR